MEKIGEENQMTAPVRDHLRQAGSPTSRDVPSGAKPQRNTTMADATTKTAADEAEVTTSVPDTANPESPTPAEILAEAETAAPDPVPAAPANTDTPAPPSDAVLAEAAAGLTDPEPVVVESELVGDEPEAKPDFVAQAKAIIAGIDKTTWVYIVIAIVLVIAAISVLV